MKSICRYWFSRSPSVASTSIRTPGNLLKLQVLRPTASASVRAGLESVLQQGTPGGSDAHEFRTTAIKSALQLLVLISKWENPLWSKEGFWLGSRSEGSQMGTILPSSLTQDNWRIGSPKPDRLKATPESTKQLHHCHLFHGRTAFSTSTEQTNHLSLQNRFSMGGSGLGPKSL